MTTVLLIDTCVWLDLAKDPHAESILSAIEELMESGDVELIIPDLVKEEFARNKDRVAKVTTERLTQEFKRLRIAIENFAEDKDKDVTLKTIEDVHHKLPILSETIYSSFNRIQELFKKGKNVKINNSIKSKAVERGLQKKAPFLKNTNSMADALLIEIYGAISNAGASSETRYIFVTNNTTHFSDKDNRIIHPDIAAYFSCPNSIYHIDIVQALREIDESVLATYQEEYERFGETRGLREIIENVDELFDKIWYNRFQPTREGVRTGRIKVIPKNEWKEYNPYQIVEDIWQGACAKAKEVEERYPEDLGPWGDFEWGMLNGKLSALRWILGDEWDMLDT